jgi:hypothetical protein
MSIKEDIHTNLLLKAPDANPKLIDAIIANALWLMDHDDCLRFDQDAYTQRMYAATAPLLLQQLLQLGIGDKVQQTIAFDIAKDASKMAERALIVMDIEEMAQC